jgi:hypothetical protein
MKKILITVSALLALAACKEIDTEYKVPLDQPAVLGIVSLVDLNEVIELTEPASLTVRLVASAESVSDQPLKVMMAITPDRLAAYNTAHGTMYSLLPSEAVTLDTEPVIMPRYGKKSSDFAVTIRSELIPDEDIHVLPISLGTVTGSDRVEFSQLNSTVYVLVRKIKLAEPVLLDRSLWQFVYVSSESSGETNKGILTGFASHMLDGDPKTYWNYNPSAPEEIRYAPFYIVFDLGEEVSVRGFEFVNRLKDITNLASDPRTPPHTVTMQLAHTLTSETGMNDDDYYVSEDFGPSDLPYKTIQDIYLSGAYAARYIRFIWRGAYNQSATSINPGNKGASLAEFYVWGNEL